MTRNDQTQIALVATPLVAAVALFVFAVSQQKSFARDGEARQKVEAQRAQLIADLAMQANQPEGKVAAVEVKPTEESAFLSMLRGSALSSGVKIIRWNALGQNNAPPPSDPANPLTEVLKDVDAVSGTLEVAGPYRSVLSFTNRLENSSRLVNFTNVNWNKSDVPNTVRMTATVTRYVMKPASPAPTTPDAKS